MSIACVVSVFIQFQGSLTLIAECSLEISYTVIQLCVLECYIHTTMDVPAKDKSLYFSILPKLNLYPIGHQAQSDVYFLHLHLFTPPSMY